MGKSRFSRITDEEFSEIIKKSTSVRDSIINLGYSGASGTMHRYIKGRINRLGLSTDHFRTFSYNEGGKPKYSLEEILIENSPYLNTGHLKQRILKEKLLKYKCVKCGNTGNWRGSKLVLQLDHINGVYNDHRLENLRFLCPNCHSQTETYSGKNNNSYVEQ